MTKRMLMDTTHAEETRVVVLDGNRLDDFDVETQSRRQLKGNIYLAKVVRVEPSLQAAFVEYGGNRHGFLAFGEIHPDYYQIPVADRQRLLQMQEDEARAEEDEDEDEGGESQPPVLNGVAEEPHPAAEAAPLAAQPDPVIYDAAPQDEPHDRVGGGEADAPASAQAPSSEPAPETAHETFQEPLGVDSAPELAEAPPSGQSEPHAHQAAEPHALNGHDPAEHAEDAEGAIGSRVQEVPAEPAPAPEIVGGGSEQEGGDEVRAKRQASRFLRNYKIQEVIRRRQILLVQVVKEERGTKGAALTTYISLAGRFSVLMPNSPRGGGISRKITSAADRRRLKEITAELEIPRGMGLIVRTAGAARPKPEIRRDCEYLLRLWDDIRDLTMQSVAPALIYEEASLIKRAIRDVYSRDVDEILVDGEDGWRAARDFMRMLMPTHVKKVQLWREDVPLFARHGVEAQLDSMLVPTVQLRSGGYLVINQTEALVAIDVNSGRSTRERGIEETALRTNLEAAEEVARQVRLRDLAGLIVIDFIDMESKKNNAAVERRIKDALKDDRARIQVGHISHFGLMEMSRQRLRPSLAETSLSACPHCGGTGHVRSTESAALHVLRAIEEEGGKRRASEIMVHVASAVALFILNHKRQRLMEIEQRTGMRACFSPDDSLLPAQTRIDRLKPWVPVDIPASPLPAAIAASPQRQDDEAAEGGETSADGAGEDPDAGETDETEGETAAQAADDSEEGQRRRRKRRRRRGGRRDEPGAAQDAQPMPPDAEQPDVGDAAFPVAFPGAIHVVPAAPFSAEDFVPSGQAAVQDMPAAPAEPAPLPVPGHDEAGEAAEESAKPKPRGRRGGRRRSKADIAAEAGETAPPMPYSGPTPADPFGNLALDIFDVIERAEAGTPVIAAAPQPVPASAPPAPAIADEAPAVTASAPQPAPDAPALAPEAAPMPADEAVTQDNDVVAGPAVKPVLIGEGQPAAERKRGWWKR